MAISYKTIPYILPLQMVSLYNIAVALKLERLYNKTSDSGNDYKRAVKYSPILINVRTLYNAHVITSKYIAKM